REAVLKGSFDKYAQSIKGKKGTAEVDAIFLKEIESWREMLAHNLALRNPGLTQRELNFAVQSTIDRIIFLRICEDRGIEDYGRLMALQNGDRTYKRLCELFRQADDRYNSGLFHFREEKDRPEPPDDLTLRLNIDDKPLKDIIRRLYYPESPYEFSVLPADILGQVYEQFLGKVIRLTPGHHAVVEDKPEVKKAGGVYYTPTYIVDYIVKNTVGKLLEGKKPKQVAKLKILDPACGSGSFLIGSYQYLLDWHRDWYVENEPKKWATGRSPTLYQGSDGDWRLTTVERKRILLNNIFGVDIDPQAVEVTKLSLLLKVLEGETGETLNSQLRLFHERALPDLGNNIKCGNSLIGPDFYEGQQMSLLDEDERYRINAFDWNAEFSEIMQAGGFDVVIGNPPYIPIEMMSETQKAYFQQKHPQLERKYDSSIVFILALLQKLQPSGRLGFISSVTWQTGENFAKFREHLFTKAGVLSLVNLPFDVFKNAYVDTCVYVLSRKPTESYLIHRFPKKQKAVDLKSVVFTEVPVKLVRPPDFKVVLEPRSQSILSRATEDSRFAPLGSFTISTQGLAENRYKQSERPAGDDWYPFLNKGQVQRYSFEVERVVYVDLGDKPSLKHFYDDKPKLLVRRIVNRRDRLMATYTERKLVLKKDINPFIITHPEWNSLFVLGVLNSRLVSYLYVNTSSIATKDDFRQTTLAELRRVPIPRLTAGETLHDHMVSLVEAMLSLHKQFAAAKTPTDKTAIQRQINATDQQIDQLVYELYGLTDKEKRIVEDLHE
ncbi:MAG: N-6 DNA methylase, partial [Actinomycetota bacterium]